MTDGKNAVGLTGFPTPNTAAGIAGYLLLLFDDKEWAQWILGALEPLAQAYNFYESGDLSPDEAAENFRVIIQQAPYNLKTCANPAGGKILRVDNDGKVQQLSDANTWEDPDGDYTIPPVPQRTDGSPQDQICLASKNCAHVLELLYENVTDSFNGDLDQDEAQTALVLGMIGLIGAEFAPITFALVSFFAVAFGVLYGLLEFLGADLWDENFTNNLTCILQACATNIDGVVTFDYTCFNDKLAAQYDLFTLTTEQLRLFGQIQYLLLVIGGVDALNHAGATTAITDDDCSFCPSGGSICVGFDEGDVYDFYTNPAGALAPVGALDMGFGNPDPSGKSDINISYSNYQMWVSVRIDLLAVRHLTAASFQFYFASNVGDAIYRAFYFLDNDSVEIAHWDVATGQTQNEWLGYDYGGDPLSGVRYVVALLGQSSGTAITGDIWVDNICATWDDG